MAANSDMGWTSIPVRSGVRDRLSQYKRQDESWSDTLCRITDETPPSEDR